MSQERDRMIAMVFEYTKADPEAVPFIVDACSQGIGAALRKSSEKCADLECALVALATDRKNEWSRNVLLQKLEKWNGQLSLRWDWFIDKVKKAA